MPKKPKRIRYDRRTAVPHREVWRAVDGAIRRCFKDHPEYMIGLTVDEPTMRGSIAKRVTGAVKSLLRKRGDEARSGAQ
jgi:NADPH-dependent curcumin reductase CurA